MLGTEEETGSSPGGLPGGGTIGIGSSRNLAFREEGEGPRPPPPRSQRVGEACPLTLGHSVAGGRLRSRSENCPLCILTVPSLVPLHTQRESPSPNRAVRGGPRGGDRVPDGAGEEGSLALVEGPPAHILRHELTQAPDGRGRGPATDPGTEA